MAQQEKYLEDIAQIKSMMQQSSRFLSLSGLSGILIGFYAIIGAYLAHYFVGYGTERYNPGHNANLTLLILASSILILSIFTSWMLTLRNARKKDEDAWNHISKLLTIQLAVPIVSGGLVCLYFLFSGASHWVAPLTLIFYGLGLINASKYTFKETYYLGFSEVVIGVIALYWEHWSLIFWAFGFGVLHIAYGWGMFWKYER